MQPDVTKVGGISEQIQIARMANAFGVKYIGHGWNTAVGLAADLQIAAAVPTADLVEYIGGSPYIDDITVSGCDWLEPKGSVSDEGLESFVFNSTTAGTPLAVGQTWWLRPRAILGGKAFPYGPAKVVTATGLPDTFAGWASTEYPGHSLSFNGDLDGDGLDDGIEYAFSLDPTRSSPVPEELSFPVGKIEIARDLPIHRVGVVYGAQWSEDLVNWSSQGVTIRFEDGKIIASVMKGLQSRFLRWNITPQ